jgi:Asp-tRNA(Asn)/Glu-tRNA(Gln) amidotransferase A subunit family amidase
MWTIHEAAAAIRERGLSAVDLLETCLERIEQTEPRVRAWVLVDRERARAEAEARDREARRGEWRGPLHGIPLGVKDIIDVFDSPTAAGSRLWADSVARQDATVVRRLREAGAVFVGKTVTTQYASFDPPPTRNPWNLNRTPGGSSSGSAAAVAVGTCLGALASQTGGSITRPASFCGVASCKPTYGRVSCHGIVPLAHSMDHPGPMARCVTDLAILLQTIAGPDPLDPVCADRSVPAYITRLSTDSTPPRLGRLRGLFDERADAIMAAHVETMAGVLESKGAEVVDVALPTGFAEVSERHRLVMAVEAAQFHEPRLRRHPEDYAPNITQLLNEGLSCPAPEYARCKEHQRALSRAMRTLLKDFDALLTPATKGPAPDAATTGDPVFNSPWSYTGLPTVSFPSGHSPNVMPLAIQLVGSAFAEAELLAAAAWCEKALGFALGEPPLVAK